MKLVLPNEAGISEAIKILKGGGVVVYPTDTAYGLGGIFNKKKVVSRVLKIKNRTNKKFTVICSDLLQAKKFFKLKPSEMILAKRYWPGPLSIAVSFQFAIRVPKNKVARELAQKVGQPLIATSANLSGKKDQYLALAVFKEFKNKKHQPDLIVNAGRLKTVKPSTLVKIVKNKVVVLRQGPVKIAHSA